MERSADWLKKALAAAVFLTTLAVFWPAVHNGFVNWDDGLLIVDSAGIRGLDWSRLLWMLSSPQPGDYAPLSLLSYALDYRLWGLDPAGYHLTNVLLHSLNAVLFYLLALRLLNKALPDGLEEGSWKLFLSAAFSALFFSLHPLRVESVAWASERRDVLCGFFCLATLRLYLRTAPPPGGFGRGRTSLAPPLAAYALALLSKSAAVTLPLALIVIDLYPLGRLPWDPRRWARGGAAESLREKIPFFLLAALAAMAELFVQNTANDILPLSRFGFSARLAQAAFGLVFYVSKTLWPFHLAPLLERPRGMALSSWPFWADALTALAAGALVVFQFRGRRWRAGPALGLFYVLTLLPVLGLIPFGKQIAADRYSYLSCLGWALLAGAGLGGALLRSRTRARRSAALGAAAIGLAALGALSRAQIRHWRDSFSLWSYEVSLEPRSAVARVDLGASLMEEGMVRAAQAQYRRALAIDPEMAAAHNNLGAALAAEGKTREAAMEYRRALEIDPGYADARGNLPLLQNQGNGKNVREGKETKSLVRHPGRP